MNESIPAARDPRRELEFLRERVRRLARGRWASDLEDVAMEAWVNLDRALRREVARNLDALMTRVARFAWIDFVRRRRNDPLATPEDLLDDDATTGDRPPPDDVDPDALAMLRFFVLEYFARHGATECADIARHWFAGRNHAEIGRLVGEKRDAIAKRWERCRRRVVDAFRADPPEPLRGLASGFDGGFL